MSKAIFEEQQQFRQWWIWVLMAVVTGISLYSSIQNQTDDLVKSFWSIGVLILIILALFTTKLSTRIDKKGIHIKFFPFHFSFKSYHWEDINQIKVTSYSPIGDYGGWGYRISFKGKGKAFNVSGNKGIYLETFSGKKCMIGTQKPEEAKQILSSYQKSNA